MKLIGCQGDTRYLVEVEPRADGERMARILDLDQKQFFSPFLLYSIVARGYWEEYTGKPGELKRLLARIDWQPDNSDQD